MNFLSILILTIGHPYYKPIVSSILLYLESEASDRGITTTFTAGSVEIGIIGCSVEIGIIGCSVEIGIIGGISAIGFKLGLLDGTAEEVGRVNSGLFLN
jgi:hypothetical protein